MQDKPTRRMLEDERRTILEPLAMDDVFITHRDYEVDYVMSSTSMPYYAPLTHLTVSNPTIIGEEIVSLCRAKEIRKANNRARLGDRHIIASLGRSLDLCLDDTTQTV